jgi:hypothetical protein
MKIDQVSIEQWATMIDAWLNDKAPTFSRATITSGSDAWVVWSRAVNNPLNVYKAMPDVTDGHIQTALERIFPSVTFKDAKRY